MTALIDALDTIDRNAPAPIYEQIKRVIEDAIRAGILLTGEKLPSENDLVATLAVSRMTINRALRELSQAGVIQRVHGVGSFVAQAPRHASLIELHDIAHETAALGQRHSTRVLSQESREVNPEVAARLELAQEVKVVHYLEAVHYQDDTPIQHESRYVNPTLTPDLLAQDFTRTTTTAWLLASGQPEEMEHIVSATVATPRLRSVLHLAADAACLQLSRRTWRNGQVVTWATFTYPGERYQLAARYNTDRYRKVEESS
ncbi:MAG: histidine utilization repressor [Pseudomonadota bacterium]